MMQVWSLSANLRRSGVELPPMDWPDLPAMAPAAPLGLLPPDAEAKGTGRLEDSDPVDG